MLHQLDQVWNLSDRDLTAALQELARDCRTTECQMLIHLIEMSHRRLYAQAGYGSLFTFCLRELKFSEGTACRRLAAAKVVRLFPLALTYLADDRLHVTALAMLEKHLTEANHVGLLEKAVGCTKRELEWLLVAVAPKVDVADGIRKLPVGPPSPKPVEQPPCTRAAAIESSLSPPTPAPTPVSTVAPLAVDRVMVKFSASAGIEAKIGRARELLAHKYPRGQLEDVMNEALEALLDQLAPERKLARRAARAARQAAKSTVKEKTQLATGRSAQVQPSTLRANRRQAGDVAGGRWPMHLCQSRRPAVRGDAGPGAGPCFALGSRRPEYSGKYQDILSDPQLFRRLQNVWPENTVVNHCQTRSSLAKAQARAMTDPA